MLNWLMNKSPDAVPLSFGGFMKRGLVLFVAFVLFYQLWIFLHICWWIKFNPHSSAFMEDRLEIIQEKNLMQNWSINGSITTKSPSILSVQ